MMRTVLLTALALLIGFGLGWFARPTPAARASKTTPAASAPALPATPPPAAAQTPPPAPVAANPKDIFRTRIETVRWLRKAGIPTHLPAFGRDAVNPSLARILDLGPDETNRLQEASQEARRTIEAARLANATQRTSDDGKTLVVESPPIDPAASRAIYERLLASIKSTLGPERFEVFNELSGEGFDRGFDQFSLNSVRYELVLAPVHAIGTTVPYFEYKRHHVDPTGASKGWSGNTVTLADLERNDPILSRFIPEQLRRLPPRQ